MMIGGIRQCPCAGMTSAVPQDRQTNEVWLTDASVKAPTPDNGAVPGAKNPIRGQKEKIVYNYNNIG